LAEDKELLRFQKACEEAQRYRPNFSRNFAVIKPAIGFLSKDGVKKFYFVLWFPSEKFENPDQEYGGVLMGPKPWIVTSNGEGRGEIILWHRENLISERIWPESDVDYFDLRWSAEDFWGYWQSGEAPTAREVYDEVVALLKRYVEFQHEAHYAIVALWIIGTYLHPLFTTYPFLYFHGTRGVGKSKTLNFIRMVAFNAINSVGITASSLFRCCQGQAATLLIDESGYLRNKQRYDELRTLLYGRYKDGATVQRTDRDTGRVQHYRVFGPTALANIEGLEDVLQDRVIEIVMLRSLNPAILNSEISEDNPVWQRIRNKLYRLAHRRWRELEQTTEQTEQTDQPTIPLGGGVLSGRALELWKPILQLAKWVGEDVFNLVLQYAQTHEEMRREEENVLSNEHTLLAVLLNRVEKDDYYNLKDIKRWMADEIGCEPTWLTERWISNALKRFGFAKKRKMKSIQIYLSVDALKNAAARIGLTPPPTNIVGSSASSASSANQISEPPAPASTDSPQQPKIRDLFKTTYKCRICGSIFASHEDFQTHLKLHGEQDALSRGLVSEPTATL
jgi:hypothetical protein